MHSKTVEAMIKLAMPQA